MQTLSVHLKFAWYTTEKLENPVNIAWLKTMLLLIITREIFQEIF